MVGYDSNFLGKNVPLPTVDASLKPVQNDNLSAGSDPNDTRRILRHYHNYTIAMSEEHRTALFCALNVNQETLKTGAGTNKKWRVDDKVGADNQLDNDYYKDTRHKKNLFDRGHLAHRASASWGPEADKASDDTYWYPNASLQHRNFNQDEWVDLEEWIKDLTLATTKKINVVTGPIFGDFDRIDLPNIHPPGRTPATIPAGFYKVVSYINQKRKLEVRCFVMFQEAEFLKDSKGVVDFQRYQYPLEKIEELTKLQFHQDLHDACIFKGRQCEVDDCEEIRHPPPLPAPPGTVPEVVIVAAMANPRGTDHRNEWIFIANLSDETVDLSGWSLRNKQKQYDLSGSLEPGYGLHVQPLLPIQLSNKGGAIMLFKGDKRVHRVHYKKAKSGRPAFFLGN